MKKGTAFLLLIFPYLLQAQYWNQTPALSTCGGSYLIAAANVKSSVYVVDNNQIFAFSKDAGESWTRPSTTPSSNPFVNLTGVGNRLYASKKLNTFDYTLEYTTDDGATWTTDTIGLPLNTTKSGKRSLNIRDMGNGYILAFDGTTACTKKLTETAWTIIRIDDITNVDVWNHKGIWFAIGPSRLLTSANQGKSWSTLNTTGLPSSFQGFKLASNQIDKLYVTSGPQSGGQIIYYSEDMGKNWTATNSAGLYTHFAANLGAIYAVDDHVFAAVSPVQFDSKNPPPFISSGTNPPNFSKGDTSGIIRGSTTGPLPFFFHVDNKLFTMFWQLYSSEPGFEGKQVTAVKYIRPVQSNAFPNPVAEVLYIVNTGQSSWTITSNLGKVLLDGNAVGNFEIPMDNLEPNTYYLQINGETQLIIKI